MAFDPFGAMIDQLYASDLAADATIDSLPGVSFRVQDKTAGIEQQPGSSGVSVPTLVPACVIRRPELTAAGVTDLGALMRQVITFNGAAWRIMSHRPKPQPRGGEAGGEVFLYLRSL